MNNWVRLDDWMEIKISGPQTIEFLNGIITKDLISLEPNVLTRSAFLTPQAKVRSIFWLKKTEENEVYFYCNPSMKQALVEDLLKYKLSMDVKLEDITEETPNLYFVSTDEKIPGLSNDRIGFTIEHHESDPEGDEISYDQFVSLLVKEGITPVDIMEGENPYELGIDDIIHLEKGCFLGQEPISRMYHRGNPRKYIYQVECDTDTLTTDQPIHQNGDEVGEILITSGNVGLAFLRRTLDSMDNLNAGDVSLVVNERIGSYPANDR